MKTKSPTKNKYQLTKLALISIVFTCLLFVGYVPASMAQGSEFESLGVIINGTKSSDQIYANGNMQAEVTVFWTFDDTVPDKEIYSVKLVDKRTREDIDSEGWNYKTGETDYNSENEYLHQISQPGGRGLNFVRESGASKDSNNRKEMDPRKYKKRFNRAKTGKVDIVSDEIQQSEEDGFIDLFVNYNEENTTDSVEFCVELTSVSGYVESTCDLGTEDNSAVLETESPKVYPLDSWGLMKADESSDRENEWDSRFTFFDLFNNDPSYPGTQKLDTNKQHVSAIYNGLNYPAHEALLYDFDEESDSKSQTMVWPVEQEKPDEVKLELVGLTSEENNTGFITEQQERDNRGTYQSTITTIDAPDENPPGWAYRLLQIDHYAQWGENARTVFYGYDHDVDTDVGHALQMLIMECESCNDNDDRYSAWDSDGRLRKYLNNVYAKDNNPQDNLEFIDRYGTTQTVALENNLDQDFVEIVE